MIEWIKDQYYQLNGHQRAFVRLVLGVLGVLVLIVILANHQADAASYTATSDRGNTITISDQKCSIDSPWFKNWFDGTMIYNGKMFKVCWRLIPGKVLAIDSDGDVTAVPTQAFRKDVGS